MDEPMPARITVDNFLAVVQKSGLVDSERLRQQFEEFVVSGGDRTDAEAVANFLVQKELLTGWQADKLLQGKHKGYFLGKYRLLSLLGKGGMSSVYLAEHVLMRRRCAIKVLPSKRVGETSYLGRFHREAQAVASLDHPNIVRAYDVDHQSDKDADIHFLVMEFIDGLSLHDYVQKNGPAPLHIAVDFIRQSALGLHHAHEAGLVHRDIKPGNLLVDNSGVVKLLDLGLARFYDDGSNEALTIQHDEKVLGTADYLAPEQAIDSHLVDCRADIYSLGCTLYYLLAGRPPFTEGTLAQRLMAHQTKTPPDIRQFRADAPESIVELLQRMMAKQREDRYQTARDVGIACSRWLVRFAPEDWKQAHPAALAAGADAANTAGSAGDSVNPDSRPAAAIAQPTGADAGASTEVSRRDGPPDAASSASARDRGATAGGGGSPSDRSGRVSAPQPKRPKSGAPLGKVAKASPVTEAPSAPDDALHAFMAGLDTSAGQPASDARQRAGQSVTDSSVVQGSGPGRPGSGPRGGIQSAGASPPQSGRVSPSRPAGSGASGVAGRRSAVSKEPSTLVAGMVPAVVVEPLDFSHALAMSDVTSTTSASSAAATPGPGASLQETVPVVSVAERSPVAAAAAPAVNESAVSDIHFDSTRVSTVRAPSSLTGHRSSIRRSGAPPAWLVQLQEAFRNPLVFWGSIGGVAAILLGLALTWLFSKPAKPAGNSAGRGKGQPAAVVPGSEVGAGQGAPTTDVAGAGPGVRELAIGLLGDHNTISEGLAEVIKTYRPRGPEDQFVVTVSGGNYQDRIVIDGGPDGAKFPGGVVIRAESAPTLSHAGPEPIIEIRNCPAITFERLELDATGKAVAILIDGKCGPVKFVDLRIKGFGEAGVRSTATADPKAPIRLENCRFENAAGTGLQLQAGSAAIDVLQCRFQQGLAVGIAVQSGIEAVQLRENVFSTLPTGITITNPSGSGRLIISNNSFYRCQRGIVWSNVPPLTLASQLRMTRNLFVETAAGECVGEQGVGTPEFDAFWKAVKLSNSWNLSDRAVTDVPGLIDLFSGGAGRVPGQLRFFSTDPYQPGFLAPANGSPHTQKGTPKAGEQLWVGAFGR